MKPEKILHKILAQNGYEDFITEGSGVSRSVIEAMEVYAKEYLKNYLKFCMPDEYELERIKSEYDKRAHIGQFSGEDPSYHFQSGFDHLKEKISIKKTNKK